MAGDVFFTENEELDHNDAVQNLINYFEATYIGRTDRAGIRRPPMFPKELWNVYDITLQGLPRTNNHIEGWHNALRKFVGQSHPNIFKFIDSLRSEQNIQELKMAQISASQEPEARRSKYVKLEKRILRIVQNYRSENQSEYLQSIAHNVVF